MESVLRALERRFKHSKGTIQNSIILVVIYGFEEFIRTQLFRCPCTNYFMYSMVMMAAPALFLLGLGFMMSGGFWKSLLDTSRLKHFNERCNYRMKSLSRLFQPFLAPTAYITIALLKGEIFVCSRFGGSPNIGCHSGVQDTQLLQEKSTESNILKTHTQSQILGFGILVAATLFSLGLVCIRRCCFADDTFPSTDEFEKLEKEILGNLFREKLLMAIQEDAKKKINDVFQIRTPRDVRDAFNRAREALTAVNHPENRNGRYNHQLDLDDDETELQLMDSTHL